MHGSEGGYRPPVTDYGWEKGRCPLRVGGGSCGRRGNVGHRPPPLLMHRVTCVGGVGRASRERRSVQQLVAAEGQCWASPSSANHQLVKGKCRALTSPTPHKHLPRQPPVGGGSMSGIDLPHSPQTSCFIFYFVLFPFY